VLIREVRADHYCIPLPVALSDSTHGTIKSFELVTARVRDAEGAEGTGYTYTVGAGGAAVHALVHGFGLDRFIAEPLQIEAGLAVAPDRPGHGVDLDWRALETVRVQ